MRERQREKEKERTRKKERRLEARERREEGNNRLGENKLKENFQSQINLSYF
jgi:hypothetical protein